MAQGFVNEEYLHSELTSRIIKCAYHVHKLWETVFRKPFTKGHYKLSLSMKK